MNKSQKLVYNLIHHYLNIMYIHVGSWFYIYMYIGSVLNTLTSNSLSIHVYKGSRSNQSYYWFSLCSKDTSTSIYSLTTSYLQTSSQYYSDCNSLYTSLSILLELGIHSNHWNVYIMTYVNFTKQNKLPTLAKWTRLTDVPAIDGPRFWHLTIGTLCYSDRQRVQLQLPTLSL